MLQLRTEVWNDALAKINSFLLYNWDKKVKEGCMHDRLCIQLTLSSLGRHETDKRMFASVDRTFQYSWLLVFFYEKKSTSDIVYTDILDEKGELLPRLNREIEGTRLMGLPRRKIRHLVVILGMENDAAQNLNKLDRPRRGKICCAVRPLTSG